MAQGTNIKICGITNKVDALEAARLRADFLGFIFYPPSSRYIEPLQVAEIMTAARSEFGFAAPKAIGVFVDASSDSICLISKQATLDGAQFCGDEPSDLVDSVPGLRFRGLSLETLDRLGRYSVDAYLCDTYAPTEKGGTGRSYDYSRLKPYIPKYPLIIAGGLTPESVEGVVRDLRPWGVDVSSALEAAPGRKDHARMAAFFEAVRRV